MSDDGGMIVLAAMVVFVAGGAVWLGISSKRAVRKRRDDLARLAGLMGLEFSPEKTSNIPQRFRFLDGLARGSNRYAYNMMSGRI